MSRVICLKIVRWTGWFLLPVALLFLVSGYAMSGRYGMDVLAGEQAALALHRMLHLPFVLLLVAHTLPSVYLAMLRNGWMRIRGGQT